MADIKQLSATTRPNAGKGAARAIRREGRVPAVIYGDKKDPITISLDYSEVRKHVQSGTFMSSLFDLEVEGRKNRVIPRDVQFEPVRDFVLHVDFLRLGKGARVSVEIPCHFINEEECPGIRRGGVLNVVRYMLELVCPAEQIPEFVEVDLAGQDIGDSIHISAVPLPEGVTPAITDRDFTVATIAAPAGGAGEGEEEAAEEGAEGEEAAEEAEAEAEGESAEEE